MLDPAQQELQILPRLHGGFDFHGQRLSGAVSLDAAGMAPQNVDLSGLAQAAAPALVASHDLAPGEVLNAADVTLARLPANAAAGAVATVGDALGMAVVNGVAAGAAVTSANLSAPVVVRKGAFLVLNLSAPGMVLTAQGVALDSGGAGSVISVLNPASHAVVQAVVTGPDAASFAPGSAPISAPQSGGGFGGYPSYAQAHGGGYSSMGLGQ